MALSINNRLLFMVVCLHLLLTCLPSLVISKPTLDVASEVEEEEKDNDDDLRDRAAAGSIQPGGTEQGTQQQTEQPTADDRAPRADERATEAGDRAPEADDRAPYADERAPTADERAPEADERAQAGDDRVPEADERAPEADERAPEADERAPGADERAPYAVNNAELGSQQYGAGNVEEMVHGDMTSHGHDAKVDDDVKIASGTLDVEHIMHGSEDVHEAQEKPKDHPEQHQQQSGPDAVEKLVHGQGDVHTTTSAEEERAEDFKKDIGTENVEHMMHGSDNVHETEKKQENPTLAQEFQAGNVENMVHGQDHVHDGRGQGEGQGQTQDHYTAGEDDILKLGAVNVHDPAQRAKIATAGDISALMGGGEKKEKEGRPPTVVDSEHLMHGDGGHDHDIRRLKDLKLKQDGDQPKDRFSDLHNVIMDDGDGHHHDNDQIHRGKTITYKDIMDLGLDEDFLKGIDLKKLLMENARDYDDWQREKDVIKGESPEASFWEQVGDLRRRYLPFGRNDGQARDLTGAKLDPSQQKWVSEMEGARGDRAEGEDGVLHDIEILGSTAPKQLRHQQQHHQQEHDNYHTNGRDATDL